MEDIVKRPLFFTTAVAFPDQDYRASPSLRKYRYIERDNRTYILEPRERTIMD